MKSKSNKYYWYFLSVLLVAFYFIQATGYLDEQGIVDAISCAFFSVAFIVGASFLGRFAVVLAATFLFVVSLALAIGSTFYLSLYQSYVPFSILVLIPDAGPLISSFSFGYQIIAALAVVGIVVTFWFVIRRLELPSKTILAATLTLLLSSGLLLQQYHDSRDSKLFQEFSETPLGYFLRTGGLVPFIDGNPISERMASISVLANSIIDGSSKVLPIAYRDAIDALYAKNVTEENLFPMRRAPRHSKVMPDASATQGLVTQKNVIVVVLESFRAAESSVYGSQQSVSPFLDSLAASSLLAKKFYSTAPLTIKSETAINCGVFDYFGGEPKSRRREGLKATCLPSILREKGYSTYWFHGNAKEFYSRADYLPLIGFEHIFASEELYGETLAIAGSFAKRHGTVEKPLLGWGIPDPVVYSMALEQLEQSTKPFYAEILTVSNHLPFDWDWGIDFPPHLQNDSTFYRKYKRGMYYSDQALKGFFEGFKASSLYHNTVLVVTGDHGVWTFDDEQDLTELNKHEQFFRVPLLVFEEGIEPRVIEEPASHVDIPPTVLSLLGLDVETAFLGRSLIDEPETLVPIYSLLDTSYSFRVGDNICLSRDRCFRNGPECTDYEKVAMKKTQMACYVDQGEMMFDKQLVPATISDQTHTYIDDFLNYSMLGLQIGFIPNSESEVISQKPSAPLKGNIVKTRQ